MLFASTIYLQGLFLYPLVISTSVLSWIGKFGEKSLTYGLFQGTSAAKLIEPY